MIRLQDGPPWFDSQQVHGIFLASKNVKTRSGSHPASRAMGTGVFAPAVKRGPGREFDHLRPSSAEVKNE